MRDFVEPWIPTLSVEVAGGITIIAGGEVDKMTQARKNLKLLISLSTPGVCLDRPFSSRCYQVIRIIVIGNEISSMHAE